MPISNIHGARGQSHACATNAYREKTPTAITLPASRAALCSARLQILSSILFGLGKTSLFCPQIAFAKNPLTQLAAIWRKFAQPSRAARKRSI